MINDYKISILRGIYFSLMCPHPIASPSLYHKSYPPTLSSVPLPPSLPVVFNENLWCGRICIINLSDSG